LKKGQMTKPFRSILIITLVAVMLISLVSCKGENEMKICFFEEKSGDCTILTSRGKAAVIDCGNGIGTEICEYLLSENINVIDALVISDFTEEHFNGAVRVLSEFDVNDIYIPGYIQTGERYDDFITACDAQAIEPYMVDGMISFPIGDCSVRVYAADNSMDSEKGDHCLMTSVSCDKRNMLICGDAGEGRLKEFLSHNTLDYDLIKLPNHGAYYSCLEDQAKNWKPDYTVVIPDSNIDHSKTVELFEKYKSDVYITDNGRLIFNCDGKKLEIENNDK